MNKNLLLGSVIVLLLIAGAGFMVKNSKTQPGTSGVIKEEEVSGTIGEGNEENDALEEAKEDTEDAATIEKIEAEEKAAISKEGVKTFELDAENFKFSKKEIRVKQGEKVKIVLEVDQGFHDWTIDEFNARTKQIGEGQTDSVEFVADKKGTFEYYCSIGQHRANGMVGKLIVE